MSGRRLTAKIVGRRVSGVCARRRTRGNGVCPGVVGEEHPVGRRQVGGRNLGLCRIGGRKRCQTVDYRLILRDTSKSAEVQSEILPDLHPALYVGVVFSHRNAARYAPVQRHQAGNMNAVRHLVSVDRRAMPFPGRTIGRSAEMIACFGWIVDGATDHERDVRLHVAAVVSAVDKLCTVPHPLATAPPAMVSEPSVTPPPDPVVNA